MCGGVLQLVSQRCCEPVQRLQTAPLHMLLLLLLLLRVALSFHRDQHTFHVDSVNFSTALRLRSSMTLVLLCSHTGCRQRNARGCQDTWE